MLGGMPGDFGSYNKPIVVQNPDGPPVSDDDASFTQAYVDLVPLWWASIDAPAGRETRIFERLALGSVLSTATHVMTMRYLPGVTTRSRIIFEDGTRTANVTAIVDPQEQHITLVLLCAEVIE